MKIVLAIDGSKFSDSAAQTVIEQARPQDTEIQVLHVVEPPSLLVALVTGGFSRAIDAVWEAETMEAEALVTKVADELRSKGLKVTTAVEQGDPQSKIIDAASKWRADLIVLGSHGRMALNRMLLGSVSEAVARSAKCSVAIVRLGKEPKALEKGAMKTKVLLAIDDSQFSEAARQAVIQRMKPEQTAVCVLHVVEPYYSHIAGMEPVTEVELVARSEQLLSQAGFEVQKVIEEGDPRTAVVDYAANWKANLILVGSHGRTGLERFLMGSVAENVIRHAHCSVEIVRLLRAEPISQSS